MTSSVRLIDMAISSKFRSSRRFHALVLAAIVVVGIPTACSGRKDVEVLEVSVNEDGTTLGVGVNTCNEPSTEVSIDVSGDVVVVTASTRSGYGCGGREDCADARTVELEEPIGDRRIVDGEGDELRRSDI